MPIRAQRPQVQVSITIAITIPLQVRCGGTTALRSSESKGFSEGIGNIMNLEETAKRLQLERKVLWRASWAEGRERAVMARGEGGEGGEKVSFSLRLGNCFLAVGVSKLRLREKKRRRT